MTTKTTLADLLPMLAQQRLKEVRARLRVLDEIYGTDQERYEAKKAKKKADRAARKKATIGALKETDT